MTRRRLLPGLTAAVLAVATALTASFVTAPAAGAAPSTPAASDVSLAWKLTPTGSESRFRGLSPVSDKVAWVSGSAGAVLRTTDGGRTWASVGPKLSAADADLEFRDIEATSATHAVILSIGEGTDSRIYVTDDGGATWAKTFVNHDAAAFYDCIAFTTAKRGVAMSDPVDGKFRLIETIDGGKTWGRVPSSGMPPALTGEFGFAASGTCLTAGAGQRMYIASGGVDPGRVFRSADGGRVWQVAETPITGGAAAGVFSVQFRDAKRGIALGGDYLDPTGATGNAAWSADGGVTWKAPSSNPTGYRSGSTWVPGLPTTALAVGPTGSDVSLDAGHSWQSFDSGSFDSVECTGGLICWASGEKGRVARLVLR